MKSKSRRGAFVKWACAAAALTTLMVLANPSTPAAFKRVVEGEPPPSFVVRDLAGAEVASEDLLPGKVTVLFFWATWSPRSLEMLADLTELAGSLGEGSFQTLAINAEHADITRSDLEKIRAASAGSAATVLVDDGLKAYSAYGTMALPSVLVTDAEGKVIFTMAGYPTTMRSDLPDAVKRTLGLISAEEETPVEAYVPKNRALMYYNMGKRLYEKGQEEKAEGQLLQSVERDPDFVKPHILLGIYYKKNGRHEDALKAFGRVKELDPRDQEAGYQAAAINLRSKRFDQAEALFAELCTEYPEREELALGLALAHKYQGHEEEYKKARERAAGLFPAEARYYYELGAVAEDEKDLQEAAVLYRGALERAFRSAGRQ